MTQRPPDIPDMLPTPAEMVDYLDRYVRGQQQAKRDLAVAVYNHYLALAYRRQPGCEFDDFGKQHVLLIGPTGTGKTYLAKTLARLLGVPCGFASATSLVQTGYVGEPVDDIVRRLLAAANYDVALAERGLVFVDEIDKIRRHDNFGGPDVSGEGVQNGLLTLLDGRVVTVKRDPQRSYQVDTSGLLFVCAGAFVGLREIIERRLGTRGLGFPAGPNQQLDESSMLSRVEATDLEEFGFIPELIGRFSTISVLQPLTREDLVSILTETESAILRKQQALFQLHGIDLHLTPEGLNALADAALQLGTGARGLTRVLFRALDDVDYRPWELRAAGVTRITVGPETIQKGAPPRLETAEGSPDADGAAQLPVESLRRSALRPGEPARQAAGIELTDTEGWSQEAVRRRYRQVRARLDARSASKSGRAWWKTFERQHRGNPRLLLRIAEELQNRGATINEFFLAYVYANTENPDAILHYMDYRRIKMSEEEVPLQQPPEGEEG